MSATDPRWNIIAERAAHQAYDDSDPFRESLSSVESARTGLDICGYAAERRDSFLSLLRSASLEQQEIAIEYVLLRKTEQQIATLHGKKSQSMMGREIASIVKLLGNRLRGSVPQATETRHSRRLRKLNGKTFRDPNLLGEFAVDMCHRKAGVLFTPRAGQVSNASQI